MKTIPIILVAALTGCAGQYVPPMSVSGGFFGATVTVAEPGFTVPAKVVSAPVSTPTLVVPVTAPKTSGTASVVSTSGKSVKVPVTTGDVSTPVLDVPK